MEEQEKGYSNAINRTDSIGKESVVDHLLENISKLCTLFLKVPKTGIRARVGLEVPVEISLVQSNSSTES